MNRREFTRSFLAGAMAPALPGRALAAVATAAPAPAINQITYAWSAHYASVSEHLTVEALARRFAMAPDAAGVIFERLRHAGVLGVPNALGVARVSPQHRKPPVVAKSLERAGQKVEQVLDRWDAGHEEDLGEEEDGAGFTND